MATRRTPPTAGYSMTVLADVYGDDETPEDSGWLWPGHIPASALGMFDGDAGLGKSMVTMDLAARVTKGAPWPDGSKGGKPGDVLILAGEDTRATIAKRLRAAGADFKRVALLDDVKGESPKIPDDISILERIIKDRKVKLVIIDPIMSFLSVHSGGDQSVRRAMTPLKRLAENTGTTIIFVRHMNKTSGRNAKMAGGGSVGLLAACRFGYMFAEDPDEAKDRIFAVTKFNLDEEPESIRYRVVSSEHGGKAEWDSGTTKWRANDLLKNRAVDHEEKQERDEVVAFLSDYLNMNGGAVSPVDLFKDGREAGFTQKMLRTAKKKLGVKSVKSGSSWYWVENGYQSLRRLRSV